ncbi:MAG: glucose-6-phosphate isomerase, partial [Deltaproteobacteria bacterium]|nr:glucose-6-phosphate isomerase [Deltaproteobacteria bacterium]
LEELARETRALELFSRLMAGEVMNRIEGYPSENRQVLHFASRNLFDEQPTPGGDGQGAETVRECRREIQKLGDFIGRLEDDSLTNDQGQPFTDMVNVGIGGSDLGPRAIYLALKPFSIQGRRVHYVSNVDPDDLARVTSGLDLSRTLVNVVSKSGGTLETLTNETLIRAAFEKAGLTPERHFVCVTGKGSPMDNPQRYLACFYMFDSIGGRYSATSMVGGVTLAFALGMDQLMDFLKGAREADLAALNPNAAQNIPLTLALLGIWNRTFLGLPSLAVLPYSQALERFVAHLQQLDMESNGKQVSRQGEFVDYPTGPVVWGEPGTNGQHAFYQLIHQSRTVIPAEFIGFRQSQMGADMVVQGSTSQQKLTANLMAQSLALAHGSPSDNPNKTFPGNRPNSILITDRLTPRTAGILLSFYESKVAFQGLIWDINSFDQEGVQLGKVLAVRLLDLLGGQNQDKPPQADEALLKAAGLL